MRQLRLVGLAEDGASLVLDSPTGESYRLPLDDRLRAACRGDLTRLGQIEVERDSPLRPREIQMRVRAGESAEDVAASSGMPLDRVLRFAYPVLHERSRVVAQARSTQLRPPAPETLGALVEERLVSRGTDAASLEWDAWRREDGRWAVRLGWRFGADRGQGGDRQHSASWSLDLARRVLQPVDAAAEQLSAAEFHARTITAVTPLAVAARAADEAASRGRQPGSAGQPARRSRPAADQPGAGGEPASQPGSQPARRPRPGADRPGADQPAGRPRPGADQPGAAGQPAGYSPRPADRSGPGIDAAGAHTTDGGGTDGSTGTGTGTGTRTGTGDEPPEEEPRQVAAGGGTIPGLVVSGTETPRGAAEDDRARRATVPSWDDILLGVRRRH